LNSVTGIRVPAIWQLTPEQPARKGNGLGQGRPSGGIFRREVVDGAYSIRIVRPYRCQFASLLRRQYGRRSPIDNLQSLALPGCQRK
jgi:hypothetical protein